VNGQKLPSVTTVLNVPRQAGAEVLGREDRRCRRHRARQGRQAAAERARRALGDAGARPAHLPDVDKAASRGTLAHEDLLAVVTGEKPADLDAVPRDQRGFLRGVAAFASQHRPDSHRRRDDGRLARARLLRPLRRARALRGIDGVGLLDLKTTEELSRYKNGAVRPPYDENLLQVEGYDIASIESGYGESDYRASSASTRRATGI
jgi:hypothetical protein